jgi:hypothetical protein
VLDPANYERYKRWCSLLRSKDAQRLVATYVHYYPLFPGIVRKPRASAEVLQRPRHSGYRSAARGLRMSRGRSRSRSRTCSTNSRIRNSSPLTAGQKALIRMGSENAAIVKQKAARRAQRARRAAAGKVAAAPLSRGFRAAQPTLIYAPGCRLPVISTTNVHRVGHVRSREAVSGGGSRGADAFR